VHNSKRKKRTCAVGQILYVGDIALDDGGRIGFFAQTVSDGGVHIFHQGGKLFIG